MRKQRGYYLPDLSTFLLIVFGLGFAAGCLASWLLPALWQGVKPALRLLAA